MKIQNLHQFVLAGLFLSASAGAAGESRQSLVSLRVDGYDALKNDRSFLDVGLKKVDDAAGARCEVVSPDAKTRAAKQAWVPFDFYTNINLKEEQDDAIANGRLGEPDIFFAGDDGNRNGKADSHKLTRLVADNFRGSLDFSEGRREPSWFSFLVAFKRGKIDFIGLMSVRAWLDGDKCKSAVFFCTKTFKKGGQTHCEPDGWTRQLLEVIADADVPGALSDTFFSVTDEKLKNDVAAVHLRFQDLDTKGQPLGGPYTEKVASK